MQSGSRLQEFCLKLFINIILLPAVSHVVCMSYPNLTVANRKSYYNNPFGPFDFTNVCYTNVFLSADNVNVQKEDKNFLKAKHLLKN
jgi:hypothetical protein